MPPDSVIPLKTYLLCGHKYELEPRKRQLKTVTRLTKPFLAAI